MSSGTVEALRVLIADDSAPVAEMLRELLTSMGSVEVVGVAESEEAAIEAIRGLRPEVVVLDLQLKDGSGTAVIRAVRDDKALAGTRILVTSNHDTPQLRAGCLELGADGYYDKVKEVGALAARIAEIAASRPGR